VAQVLERNSEKFEASTKLRLDEMGEAFRLHVKELRGGVRSAGGGRLRWGIGWLS
jgi:hypothetical protein